VPGNISIPGYEFVEKLGAGSAGAVYKARQISMDRMVAIKILPGGLAADERFIERFYREARAVAKLNHPNVVTGIDVGESAGLYYFVMEYVDGDSLEVRLKKDGALNEAEALEIVRQVALALEHAYRNGIVHRDIKPGNVLMTQGGVAKLADLGVAKQAGGEGGGTGGRVFGTPYYMSPEQARAEIDIDFRSDIYSLGATLYHLLSGEPPFRGHPPAVVMAKQIAEEPEDIQDINPAVSSSAAELVAHMMAKKPEDRPETPAQLVEEITKAQEGRGGAKGHARAPARGPAKARDPLPHQHGTGTQARARRIAAERDTRSRGNPAVMIVAVGGVLLLLAGIAAVSFSGSGEVPVTQHGSAPIVATVQGPAAAATVSVTVPSPVATAPSAVAAVPDGERETAAAEAFEALKAKKLYGNQEGSALRELADQYAGTAAAETMKAKADELAEQLATEAEDRETKAEVARLRAEAMELIADGKVAEALTLLDMPDASGPMASALQEAAREARVAGVAAVAEVVQSVKALVDEGKFDEARAAYRALSVGGYPDMEATLAAGLKAIDDAQKTWGNKAAAEARAKAETAYQALCANVDTALSRISSDEATTLLAEAARDPAFSPLKDWIAEDRMMVMMFEEAVAAALKGASRVANTRHSFKMRDGSEASGKVMSVVDTSIELERRIRGMASGGMVVKISVAKLADAEIVDLAMTTSDKGDSKTFLRLGIYCAAHGNGAKARQLLDKAKELGADIAAAERRWATVLAPGETRAPAQPGEAGETAAARAQESKPSAKLVAELKKVEKRATERYQFFGREKRLWDTCALYERLEKFKEARVTIAGIYANRKPGNYGRDVVSHLDKSGALELEYAVILTHLGDTKNVPKLVEEHKRLLGLLMESDDTDIQPTIYQQNALERKRQFVEGYAAAKQEWDKLLADIAAGPTAATQWGLAQLYAPHRNRLVLPVKYLSSIIEMIEKYPDAPQVLSGDTLWELREAYESCELYEDAVAALESLATLHPEHANVKSGRCLWDVGQLWGRHGDMTWDMRDRAAREYYLKGAEALRKLLAEYPDSVYCKPDEDGNVPADGWARRFDVMADRVRVGR
jgi:hypothetical protein